MPFGSLALVIGQAQLIAQPRPLLSLSLSTKHMSVGFLCLENLCIWILGFVVLGRLESSGIGSHSYYSNFLSLSLSHVGLFPSRPNIIFSRKCVGILYVSASFELVSQTHAQKVKKENVEK